MAIAALGAQATLGTGNAEMLAAQHRHRHLKLAHKMFTDGYIDCELRANFVCVAAYHLKEGGISLFEDIALAPETSSSKDQSGGNYNKKLKLVLKLETHDHYWTPLPIQGKFCLI